jgi:hypothetical protein
MVDATRQEVPPMTLDPESYKCPEHGVDVTGQVKEKLDPNRPDVAFRRPLFGRKASGTGPFEVVVICPGADDAEPHPLTCTGRQAP